MASEASKIKDYISRFKLKDGYFGSGFDFDFEKNKVVSSIVMKF